MLNLLVILPRHCVNSFNISKSYIFKVFKFSRQIDVRINYRFYQTRSNWNLSDGCLLCVIWQMEKSVGKNVLLYFFFLPNPFVRLACIYRKMSLWRSKGLIGTVEFSPRNYITAVGAPRFKQNGFQAISIASKCFGSSKMDSPQFFRYKRDCGRWDAALAISFVTLFSSFW